MLFYLKTLANLNSLFFVFLEFRGNLLSYENSFRLVFWTLPAPKIKGKVLRCFVQFK